MAKHRSDLIQAIRESEIFLVIFDERYLKGAETYVQIELAKQMNKPFRVLVKKGLKIPDDTFDGIQDIKYAEYNNRTPGLTLADVQDILLRDFYGDELKEGQTITFVNPYDTRIGRH